MYSKYCRKFGAIVLLTILLAVVACTVKYVNRITIFVVQGQIFDQATLRPVQNVKVYFVDTGFDYVRSKKLVPLEIGQTDLKGKISARLNYPWQQKETLIFSPRAGTFDIVLEKEFYEPMRMQFDQSKLKSDNVSFLVDLKKIYLVPLKIDFKKQNPP